MENYSEKATQLIPGKLYARLDMSLTQAKMSKTLHEF